MSGKLLISPPQGRTVWHGDVKLYIKSAEFVYERDDEHDVFHKEWVLLEAGYISEPTEIPFEVALRNVENLRETYDGNSFLLRHFVGYSIARPFYTFRIWDERMVAFMKHQKVQPPADAEPHVLEVNDFGGKCKLTHDKSTYSSKSTVTGEIEFCEMTDPAPIQQVEVIIGRTETYDANHKKQDVEVRRFIVHKDSIIDAPTIMPIELDLADAHEGTENAKEKVLPTLPALTKTQKDGSLKTQVETEYWIRLVLKAPADAAAWWNSQPLTIVRVADEVSMKPLAANV